MTDPLDFITPRTELAIREHDGTCVQLLWARGTNVVGVSVVDRRNGHAFEFVLDPDENPLEAFYHPYAYAAARGLEFGATREQRETVDV